MKKNSKMKEEAAEWVVGITKVVVSHERKINNLAKLFFVSILGFSALGTYLVVKNNK